MTNEKKLALGFHSAVIPLKHNCTGTPMWDHNT